MNYQELYKIANKFYPIGIDEFDSGYSEYPGIKNLLDISNRMFDSKNFDTWKLFINSFMHELNIHEVTWNSSLSDWCYTGSLIKNKRAFEGIAHYQELVINVSFLAPIYTVFGRDRVEYLENENLIEFNPYLTVSPFGTYRNLFEYTQKMIRKNYPDHSFINFNLLSKTVKAVYVPGLMDKQDSTLYQAFFKLHDITKFPYQGDPLYE